MKKILIIITLLIPSTIYANSKIDFIINKNEINTIGKKYDNKILYPGLIHNKYDLFDISFPDNFNIKQSESKILVKNNNEIEIEKTDGLFKFLYEKLGKEKIKKSLDLGLLHIIGDYNKTNSYNYIYSSEYYLSNTEKFIKGNYLDISRKFVIENQNNNEEVIKVRPFNKNIFLGYRPYGEEPYPLFSIFDNTLIPQDLKAILNNNIITPKLKYEIQKYIINDNKVSYVFLPYYEFNINLNKGENILEIKYNKYIQNTNEIIIQELYK